MNFFQTTLQAVEVGKGQILVRIIPLLAALLIVGGAYDKVVYRGLSDAQSMDNAQLARQIARGEGFTTKFLRPQAVAQLRDYAVSQSLEPGKPRDLFPADQFPPGTQRILPDTYNAPGYPCLLAVWFHFIHPEFEQTAKGMTDSHTYSPDRWIPPLNQGFMLLTAILVFALGRRLFDDRVAWMSLVAFLGTDMVWHYTLTALSTSVLMFLITTMLMCTLEIFCVGEACFENEDHSFAPAWLWGSAVALLLAAACLTRLHLLVLLVPLFVLLILMPRASFFLFAIIALVVIGLVMPWFLHVNAVSGNPLGSNVPLLLYGQGDYTGNQIYCTTSIPSYEQLLRGSIKKEVTGFRWYFEHAWKLLGSNPLILLFGASILHQFKRRRTQVFNWLLFGSGIVLIAANNLGSATPEAIGPWNILVVLFPCMLVIGSAFFFILLDRLNLAMRVLNNLIVTVTIALTVAPLIVSLTASSNLYYSFPPYMPPLIKTYGQFAQPDEWVTTDMPWATAWYADRASLWLPDSITDFQNFHDNVCPTGILLLTPVTWSQPLSTFTTGEYKDWLPFIVALPAPPTIPFVAGLSVPTNFPLTVHTMTAPGGPDYSLWCDRPRWQTK
jgi:4-amino-4-deoxy-L-arabinose transferase-like glycosyltransferase